MKTSEEVKNLYKALVDFKKEFKQPLKDAENPYFKSKYVPLENITKAIDDIAPKHGLNYNQDITADEDWRVGVTTRITHSSGEFIESEPLWMKPEKNTPQGIGSAATYARRYSLSAMFGIASDVDDDGNEANGNNDKSNDKKASQSDLKKMETLRKAYVEKANLDYEGKKKLDNWVNNSMKTLDFSQASDQAVKETIAGLERMLERIEE